MRAFIDGFNLIRIESDEYIHDVTVLNMLFRFVKKKSIINILKRINQFPYNKQILFILTVKNIYYKLDL